MKKGTAMRMFAVLLPVAAGILSALPNVVKMNWMGDYITYCSAYSLVPVGYAIWGPFLGAVGAIALVVMGAVSFLLRTDRLKNAMFYVAILATLCSLSAAILGNFTALGGIIALLLALEAVVVRRIGT